MKAEAILLIRMYEKQSKIYKKRMSDYANEQGYEITQVIKVKNQAPLIYANGRSLILDQLKEVKAAILLVYSFQHLSNRKEELLQFIEALTQTNVQCYAVLEHMYLQEIRSFLLSPSY